MGGRLKVSYGQTWISPWTLSSEPEQQAELRKRVISEREFLSWAYEFLRNDSYHDAVSILQLAVEAHHPDRASNRGALASRPGQSRESGSYRRPSDGESPVI
jgi:hypothetical protein